jgi:hypothetical protein
MPLLLFTNSRGYLFKSTFTKLQQIQIRCRLFVVYILNGTEFNCYILFDAKGIAGKKRVQGFQCFFNC